MAQLRSMALVCLLLVLAYSSAIVMARDQVDLASLSVEVKNRNSRQSLLLDLTGSNLLCCRSNYPRTNLRLVTSGSKFR